MPTSVRQSGRAARSGTINRKLSLAVTPHRITRERRWNVGHGFGLVTLDYSSLAIRVEKKTLNNNPKDGSETEAINPSICNLSKIWLLLWNLSKQQKKIDQLRVNRLTLRSESDPHRFVPDGR